MTKESKAEGCIYIILNGTNPNEIKIGLTVDPPQRLKSLFSTSVSAPFIPKKIWYVDDMREAEKIAHCYMDGHRINKKREFFFLVTPSMSHQWAKEWTGKTVGRRARPVHLPEMKDLTLLLLL